MTPAELADHLEDGPGEVRIESVPHMKLLAAALRLAESCTRERDDDGVWLDFDTDSLANYQSARERLSGNAP